MSLVDYASSSDDEPCQSLPSFTSFDTGPSGDEHRLTEVGPENETSSLGRIRSFPHQRGNWATSVFIPRTLSGSSFSTTSV